jgi:hypothetical protein
MKLLQVAGTDALGMSTVYEGLNNFLYKSLIRHLIRKKLIGLNDSPKNEIVTI